MLRKLIALALFVCLPNITFACNSNLSPVLECVRAKTDGTYVAYFGYNNTSSSTINAPIGTYNNFTPTPANRGQPTSFAPGRKTYVFSVAFNGSNLVWKLESSSATASKTSKACTVDCAGTVNGSAKLDLCGVCNGDNSSCKDCAGVVNGGAKVDACGVCGGDNSTCSDCAGEPNGNAVIDECGVCDGDSTSCAGCDGVPNSRLVYDACGVCGGDNSSCKDCAGEPNGNAKIDLCGVCNGQNNTCLDCAGVPNGAAKVDVCGVCEGDSSSCKDCAGVPNGKSRVDSCGVCNGDDTKCADCAGVANGHSLYDVCGVCAGDGTSCLDCAGVPNGTAKADLCGVCNGSNTCLDCAGVPNGGKVVDSCGICGGKGGKIVRLKIKKKTLINKVNSVVDDVIRFYINVGQNCNGNWGKDETKQANRLSKKAIVLIQNLKEKVSLCPGQCAKKINRTTLRKINRVLENLYQLSRVVRTGAVRVCNGNGGSWRDSRGQFDSVEDAVNRCPNKACAR